MVVARGIWDECILEYIVAMYNTSQRSNYIGACASSKIKSIVVNKVTIKPLIVGNGRIFAIIPEVIEK